MVEGLVPEAHPLYIELRRLSAFHHGRFDFFFYNIGIGVALLASGGATVTATVQPLVAASLSAVATFFVAMTRILKFGSRWSSELAHQGIYAKMIYDLNAVAHLDRETQLRRITEIYERMGAERLKDGILPGVQDEGL